MSLAVVCSFPLGGHAIPLRNGEAYVRKKQKGQKRKTNIPNNH